MPEFRDGTVMVWEKDVSTPALMVMAPVDEPTRFPCASTNSDRTVQFLLAVFSLITSVLMETVAEAVDTADR